MKTLVLSKEEIKRCVDALCAPVTYDEACIAMGRDRLLQPRLTIEDLTREKRERVIREFFDAIRGLPATAHIVECARALEPYSKDRMKAIHFKRVYAGHARLVAERGPEPLRFSSRAETERWIRDQEIKGFAQEVAGLSGTSWIAIAFGPSKYVGDGTWTEPAMFVILDENRMIPWEA